MFELKEWTRNVVGRWNLPRDSAEDTAVLEIEVKVESGKGMWRVIWSKTEIVEDEK